MIFVQRESFDTGTEIQKMAEGRRDIGAIVSFTGLVRDFNDNKGVQSLTLEHYPGMTEKQLAKIEEEANRRWDLQGSLIIHRFGRMEVSEPIVLVVTASAHRGDAFAAAEFLMDWLKTQAPFWKLEEDAKGSANWVEERQSDLDATKKWRQSE